MSNDRQVTLTKCDYCGKYYEACNIHRCKKQPQQEKYIPCAHCAVQKCKDCDYRMHQKTLEMIRFNTNQLTPLKDHIKCMEAVGNIFTIFEAFESEE